MSALKDVIIYTEVYKETDAWIPLLKTAISNLRTKNVPTVPTYFNTYIVTIVCIRFILFIIIQGEQQ
jgi:hypothetical protein